MSGRMVVPIALGAIVLLSRLPFVARTLWAWDSVLYARALERGFHVGFDLATQRPHPPGYILYVSFADLFRSFLGDANAGLVAVSVLAGTFAAVALYGLARRFARTEIALFVALAYAFNPLVWLYDEVAFPYSVLALCSLVLATLFWEARRRPVEWTIFASATFGLLAGFRLDLVLLLGPLWLWMVVPRGRRAVLASAAVAALAALVWFVPSALLSDGFEPYVRAVLEQAGSTAEVYSVPSQGVPAFSYNLRFVLYALAWGLLGIGLVLIVLMAAPALHWARTAAGRQALRRPDPTAKFFLLRIVPGVAFYIWVHIGDWGYVLSILPALYVLAAWLLELVVVRYRRGAVAGRAAAAALVAIPALFFLFGSDRFTASAITTHDRALALRVAYVRANFPPPQTIILAREDFLLVRHYLPEYKAWLYDPQPYADGATKRKRTAPATAIVIFTEGLQPRQALDERQVTLSPGIGLAYVPLLSGDVVEFYGDHFVVREPP